VEEGVLSKYLSGKNNNHIGGYLGKKGGGRVRNNETKGRQYAVVKLGGDPGRRSKKARQSKPTCSIKEEQSDHPSESYG